MTLLDYPDKTACTLFTVGCDFACPYCQNASLIGSRGTGFVLHNEAQNLSPCFDALAFLNSRRGLLDGVCISGGEPLLHEDLGSFIEMVKEAGFLVKLDTNGSCPERLLKLIEEGKIDYIAMDIKNTPEKYAQTTGSIKFDISPIRESIDLIVSCSIPYEFRTTVVKEFHTGEDLLSIAKWISDAGGNKKPDTIKYFLQKFIDSENVLQRGLSGYSDEEMRQFIDKIRKILPLAELRGT